MSAAGSCWCASLAPITLCGDAGFRICWPRNTGANPRNRPTFRRQPLRSDLPTPSKFSRLRVGGSLAIITRRVSEGEVSTDRPPESTRFAGRESNSPSLTRFDVAQSVEQGPLAPKPIAPNAVILQRFGRLVWGRGLGRGGRTALDSPPLPNPLPRQLANLILLLCMSLRGKLTGARGPLS